MGSEVIKNYGAEGRQDLLLFDPDHVVIVGLDTPDGPEHPLWDERIKMPVDETDVLNVLAHGIIEPASVRRNGERRGKPIVEVLDGRQRTRWLREANKRLRKAGKDPMRLPATVKRGDDKQVTALQISANEIRKGDTPLVRAQKIKRYLDRGATEHEAAISAGVDRATVKNLLALLDCADEVQRAVEAGTIGATLAAKEFSGMPRADQRVALTKLIEAGVTKGAAAKETVRSIRQNGAAAVTVAPRKKMRPKPLLLRWRKALGAVDKPGRAKDDAAVARAVLAYVLGSDSALKDYPHLEEPLG